MIISTKWTLDPLLALHSAVNMISDSPKSMLVFYLLGSYFAGDKVQFVAGKVQFAGDAVAGPLTSIKYKVEHDERYLPYIELGRWLCSHFQLETPLNFHKPITQKLYNGEPRETNLTLLDYLCILETPKNWWKHE